MPITDLFSNRNAPDQGAKDVWEYDAIPAKLRVQIFNLVKGALGPVSEYSEFTAAPFYQFISESVAHEHGRHSLASHSDDHEHDVLMCITSERELPVWLDCIEFSFRCVERIRSKLDDHGRRMANITIPAADAIAELNERFRRAGFGY
jgi:hypothetical protein